MDDINRVKSMNSIPEREYVSLMRILSYYSVEANNILAEGNSYRIYTHDGIRRVVNVRHGKDKIERVFKLTHYLLDKKYYNVMKCIETKDGAPYVKYKKSYVYMTDWIQGKNCDFNDFNELLDCIKVFANFHSIAGGLEGRKYFSAPSNLKNWPSIFMKRCNRLVKYGRIIESKRLKSEFDVLYRDSIDCFHKQALASADLLNNSSYNNLMKRAKNERHICLGNPLYRNILIASDKRIYITGLDKASIDIRMNDLGKFIRKIMSQKTYIWDFNAARDIIETYNDVLPMSKEELKVLLAIIIFPYKFYKLGKRRYENRKPLVEEKYIRKLKRQIRYVDNKLKFIKEYRMYYNIDINIDI